MDRISNLSDDLLLKIFSYLPTKYVVTTTLLSKRWKSVWTMVPRFDFDDGFELDPSRYETFTNHVGRTMSLRTSPVLESLRFDVGPCCSTQDMVTWIRTGMVQGVRELEIFHTEEHLKEHRPIKLPKSLYTYEKLEVLKLTYSIGLDVPVDVWFPSLKTLHLISVKYETKDCHSRLLSGCPVLEELVLDKSLNSHSLRTFYVEMPSLQRLSVVDVCEEPNYGLDGLHMTVINAPSLKYLNFVDYHDDVCLCENMPEVVVANVKVVYNSPEKLLGSIPSVKRLCLCLPSSLCNELPCTTKSIRGHWKGPSSVPECLMSHLHTFKWKNYNTKDEEKKIVAYILNHARQLKIVGISGSRYYSKEERLKKLNELVSLPRASSSCQLLMD
uniref:F-box domain-containing protein n=1 Tax=Brassica campestris TaxID=3711 RepID=M4FFI3_BRACM